MIKVKIVRNIYETIGKWSQESSVMEFWGYSRWMWIYHGNFELLETSRQILDTNLDNMTRSFNLSSKNRSHIDLHRLTVPKTSDNSNNSIKKQIKSKQFHSINVTTVFKIPKFVRWWMMTWENKWYLVIQFKQQEFFFMFIMRACGTNW